MGKFLQATATYTDPQGSGKSAAATTGNAVQAAPIVNVKSAFSSETDTRTIAENTEAEQNIGAPVTATDANNDTLAYSLDAVGAESFGIVTETGQLKTKADLDFETQPRHTVTVSVRDSKNADGNADTVDDDSIEVTITVTNVDEDGSVTLSPGQPQVDTPLTATLTDPDGAVSGGDLGVGQRRQRKRHLCRHHQRGHGSQLHAGRRRRGQVPAGHRNLHRRGRFGQECRCSIPSGAGGPDNQ